MSSNYTPTLKSLLQLSKRQEEARLISLRDDLVQLKEIADKTTTNNLLKREYYFQIGYCIDAITKIESTLKKIDFLIDYITNCAQLTAAYTELSAEVTSGNYLSQSIECLLRKSNYNSYRK